MGSIFARCSAFVVFSLALTGSASAEVRLVMPFACHAVSGRIDLDPAPDTSYRIYGAPERRSFTACSPLRPDLCRNWVLHRFDIDCGGARVSWLSVVDTAAARWNPSHAWVSEGQLHLRMGRWWSGTATTTPCRMGWRYGDRRRPYGGFGAPCANTYSQGIGQVVDLPSGFAPIPARFARLVQQQSAISAEAQNAPAFFPLPHAQVMRHEQTSKNAVSALADVGPMVRVETLVTPLSPQSAHRAKPLGADREFGLPFILISFFGLIAFLSGVVLLRYPGPRDTAWSRSNTSSEGRAHLLEAEGSELEDWLPRNRTEALRVLGVSPQATSEFIKTTVRRLRRAWHPDLAQSGEDRRRRNQKLKQINVAWDIICGKRAESYA